MKILIPFILSVCGPVAFAGLGSSPAALPATTVLSATVPGTNGSGGYTETTKTLDTGTEIREYVTPAGTVFAVSWSGPSLPDLQELLGVHFQSLLDHLEKHPGAARAQVIVQQPGAVIISAGRMGNFQGKAWVPALLPAGFTPRDIREGQLP